jgi:hypothetical protein
LEKGGETEWIEVLLGLLFKLTPWYQGVYSAAIKLLKKLSAFIEHKCGKPGLRSSSLDSVMKQFSQFHVFIQKPEK